MKTDTEELIALAHGYKSQDTGTNALISKLAFALAEQAQEIERLTHNRDYWLRRREFWKQRAEAHLGEATARIETDARLIASLEARVRELEVTGLNGDYRALEVLLADTQVELATIRKAPSDAK
jgi:hypothetical protein